MKCTLVALISCSLIIGMEPEQPVELFSSEPVTFPQCGVHDRAISITTSPDGSKLLVGTGEKAHALKLYDVATVRDIVQYDRFNNISRINAISCTTDHDAPWFVAVGDHGTTIIDIRSGEQVHTLDGDYRPLFKLSLAQHELKTYSASGKCYLWDLRNTQTPQHVEQLPYSSFYGCDYHEKQGWFIGTSTSTSPIISTIKRYPAEKEAITATLQGPLYTLALSQKGSLLAASTLGGLSASQRELETPTYSRVHQIVIYKTKQLSNVQSLTTPDRINGITFAPKLVYLAAASYDGNVLLWKKKK